MMATIGKRAKATPWQQNFLTKANKTFADAGQEEPYIVNPLAGPVPGRQMAATTGQPTPLITSGSTTPHLSESQPVATAPPVTHGFETAMAERNADIQSTPPGTETFVNPETGRRETREVQRVTPGKQGEAVFEFDKIGDVGDGQVIDLGGANPISGAENSTISLDDAPPEVMTGDSWNSELGIPIWNAEGQDKPHFVAQTSDGTKVALPVGPGTEAQEKWDGFVNDSFQSSPETPKGVGANNQALHNAAQAGGPGSVEGKILWERSTRDKALEGSVFGQQIAATIDGVTNGMWELFPGDAAAAQSAGNIASLAYAQGEIEADEFEEIAGDILVDITGQITQREEDFANILNETLQRGEAQVDRANKRKDVLTGRINEAYDQEQGRMDARNMRSGLGRGSTALRPALARLQEDRARALAEARAENYDNLTQAERTRDVDYLRALEAKANATQSLRADRNLVNARRAQFRAGRAISPLEGFEMAQNAMQPSQIRILS